jgi:hypothetical protein
MQTPLSVTPSTALQSQRAIASVALREEPFLSRRDRSVILIHWDAIPVKENITMK